MEQQVSDPYSLQVDVYVLNLKARQDRWATLLQIWGKTNFALHRIEAVENKNGNLGCTLSHLKAVEYAKEHKLSQITVWEDDCIPFRTSPQNVYCRWNILEGELKECKDWLIFSGVMDANWTKTIEKIRHPLLSESLMEVDSGFLTHFICYSSRSYDILLNELSRGISELYDTYLYRRFRPWVSVPFLATQRTNYSNISRKQKSIEKNMRASNQRLRLLQIFRCKTKKFQVSRGT
jgi:hypothetical protein